MSETQPVPVPVPLPMAAPVPTAVPAPAPPAPRSRAYAIGALLLAIFVTPVGLVMAIVGLAVPELRRSGRNLLIVALVLSVLVGAAAGVAVIAAGNANRSVDSAACNAITGTADPLVGKIQTDASNLEAGRPDAVGQLTADLGRLGTALDQATGQATDQSLLPELIHTDEDYRTVESDLESGANTSTTSIEPDTSSLVADVHTLADDCSGN